MARPNLWGNPWAVGSPGRVEWRGFSDYLMARSLDRDMAVAIHRGWLLGRPVPMPVGLTLTGEIALRGHLAERRERVLASLPTLRGRDLACWCGEGPCHADVLLDLANREPQP